MTGGARNRACVIGAGIAGLVTAKVLLDSGFDVDVFEKGSALGGVWSASRTYPGLRANNPRELYAFADHPFPASASPYPTAAEMRDYLESYADRFGVLARIRFDTEVVAVTPHAGATGGSNGWEVRVRSAPGSGGEEVHDFDYVVVCNGVFSAPKMPCIEGAERFTGSLRHSSQLAGDVCAAGKRVVVVGGSKSALDCAVWAAREGAACTLVFRTPYWMWPRYVYGLINLQWLMFSRASALLLGSYRPSRAEAWLHARARTAVAAAWRALTRVVRRHARGGGALVPDYALPEHIESTGAGNDAYRLVAAGKLATKRAEIRRFIGERTLELTTGETLQADLVVLATGFRQDLPFLDAAVRDTIEHDGAFRLFRMILAPEHRTLALNGYNSSTMCQLTAEIAAHWISDCFEGRLDLPSVEEMDAEIARFTTWLGRAMPGRRGGFFVGPWVIAYVDELLRDMRLPTRRRRTALAEHFLPAWPSNYAAVGEERRRRSRRALDEPILPFERTIARDSTNYTPTGHVMPSDRVRGAATPLQA